MPFAIRFISMGVAIALANYLALVPSARVQAQIVEVESRMLDLSEVLKGDESKKSALRFRKSVNDLKTAAGRAKEIVLKAIGDYKAEPTRANEAAMVRANAQATALQFNALEEFQEAAKAHAGAIEVVLGELEKGKAALGGQVAEVEKEKAASLAKVSEAEAQLDRVEAKLEAFIDKAGNLDPEMDSYARLMESMSSQWLKTSKDATAVQKEAEFDLRRIVEEAVTLRTKKINLKHSALASTVLRARLAQVAKWQTKALGRRELLHRARLVSGAVPVDMTSFLPDVRYPVLPLRGNSASAEEQSPVARRPQKGLEILMKRRRQREAATEKRAAKDRVPSNGGPVTGKKPAGEEAEAKPLPASAPTSGLGLPGISQELQKGEGHDE